METVSNSELARLETGACNLDYKHKLALLKEMDEALQHARGYSVIVDKVLKEVLYKGSPTKEMLDKLTEARNAWSVEMARHRRAYKRYHNIPDADKNAPSTP